MPNFRSLSVSRTAANTGVPISGFSGDGALTGPSAIVIFASNSTPLTPNDPNVSITLYPSGHLVVGTDSNGRISATATLVNTGDDQNFSIAGGGTYFKSTGLWQDLVRAVLVAIDPSDVQFDLQYSGDALTDFSQGGPPTPNSPTITNITNPDAQLNTKMDVTIQYKNADPVNSYHAMITRAIKGQSITTAVMVGSTPLLAPGATTTFTDVVDNTNNYDYYVYFYDGSLNISSSPAKVTTNAVITADPSGVYTLTPGKTHDTLYDHQGGTTNVAIPNPFIETAFLGD